MELQPLHWCSPTDMDTVGCSWAGGWQQGCVAAVACWGSGTRRKGVCVNAGARQRYGEGGTPSQVAFAPFFPCRYREENVRLTDEYKRITEQFKDLQSKFRHFELVDTRKYKEVGFLAALGGGNGGVRD